MILYDGLRADYVNLLWPNPRVISRLDVSACVLEIICFLLELKLINIKIRKIRRIRLIQETGERICNANLFT